MRASDGFRHVDNNAYWAWCTEGDKLRALAVRATSAEHARALHDRADACYQAADRALAHR